MEAAEHEDRGIVPVEDIVVVGAVKAVEAAPKMPHEDPPLWQVWVVATHQLRSVALHLLLTFDHLSGALLNGILPHPTSAYHVEAVPLCEPGANRKIIVSSYRHKSLHHIEKIAYLCNQ